MPVAGREQHAQHRFEIVDIAADMFAKVHVLVEQLRDFARLRVVEQSDSAARENPAIAAQIRCPGRVGDLIIPVLDPEGEDRMDFVRWVTSGVLESPSDADLARISELTPGYSAAAFASLRAQLKANGAQQIDEVVEIVNDLILPAIGPTRRYQTLQALLNCTRR